MAEPLLTDGGVGGASQIPKGVVLLKAHSVKSGGWETLGGGLGEKSENKTANASHHHTENFRELLLPRPVSIGGLIVKKEGRKRYAVIRADSRKVRRI